MAKIKGNSVEIYCGIAAAIPLTVTALCDGNRAEQSTITLKLKDRQKMIYSLISTLIDGTTTIKVNAISKEQRYKFYKDLRTSNWSVNGFATADTIINLQNVVKAEKCETYGI